MTANAANRARHKAAAWLSSIRHWRETERGQSLVEFTLVLPIFLVLLFGLVDFGRAFYSWLLVTNAAREGARAAAVQSDAATINSKLYASLCTSYPSNCSLDTTKMTVVKTNVQGARGQEVSVDISYAFTFVTPIGPMVGLLGGSLATPIISAHSSMRLE